MHAQEYVESRIELKQQLAVKDINRWNEFKARRDIVVAEYIRSVKKNHVKVKIIQLCRSIQVIKIINQKFMQLKLLYWQNQIRRIYGLKINYACIQRLSLENRGLKKSQTNYIRDAMAAQFNMLLGVHKSKLKEIIYKKENTRYGFMIHSEIKHTFG